MHGEGSTPEVIQLDTPILSDILVQQLRGRGFLVIRLGDRHRLTCPYGSTFQPLTLLTRTSQLVPVTSWWTVTLQTRETVYMRRVEVHCQTSTKDREGECQYCYYFPLVQNREADI